MDVAIWQDSLRGDLALVINEKEVTNEVWRAGRHQSVEVVGLPIAPQ